MNRLSSRVLLHCLHAADRLRVARLRRRLPGLELHPRASARIGHARIEMAPGSRLTISAGVVTDRLPGALHIDLGPGAEMVIGEGAWLRTAIAPVHLVAFEGARLEIGPKAFLNGCHLSTKQRLTIGRGASVGPGSRVFDADQHDLDDERLEQVQPVAIGDFTWVASDVTILRGVQIGAHCIVGARSLVLGDLPDHTLAFGQPARPRGRVGDRSQAR